MVLKLAFAGRVCTGKDARADALAAVLGPGQVLRLSFAAPLKAEVATTHGITVAELEARKAEFRTELQEVGAAGRPWKWVQALNDILEELDRQQADQVFKAYVITDLRYQNEVDMLKLHDFYTVRLTAPREVIEARYLAKLGKPLTDEQWSHESEAGIADLAGIDGDWDAEGNPTAQVRAWLAAQALHQGLRSVAALGTALGSLFKSPESTTP